MKKQRFSFLAKTFSPSPHTLIGEATQHDSVKQLQPVWSCAVFLYSCFVSFYGENKFNKNKGVSDRHQPMTAEGNTRSEDIDKQKNFKVPLKCVCSTDLEKVYCGLLMIYVSYRSLAVLFSDSNMFDLLRLGSCCVFLLPTLNDWNVSSREPPTMRHAMPQLLSTSHIKIGQKKKKSSVSPA